MTLKVEGKCRILPVHEQPSRGASSYWINATSLLDNYIRSRMGRDSARCARDTRGAYTVYK